MARKRSGPRWPCGPNAAKEPKETVLEKRVVTGATVLKCKLAPAGGFAVRFTPAR
jgi:hypothetical protein